MPEPLGYCDAHGSHEGTRCPVCGTASPELLDGERRRRLSTFVSGALRHFPGDVGLDLDDRGWTDRTALVAAVERRYGWADRESLDALVATDPKGRFEVDGARIRAAYGHSEDVQLEPTDAPVPDELYHGTAPRNVDPILAEGIRPMDRQLVHLSAAVEAARAVGARHADDPVVLRVDAAGMLADGHRITKRGVGVHTTERVPPEYVDREE